MTLSRRTPLKRKPFKSKARVVSSPDDQEYMARVRKLPCAARHLGHPCAGRMTAHHAGKKPGMRMKSATDTCVPLCWEHHVGAGIESFHGPFLGWTREQLRNWQDEQIELTRATLAATATPKAST